MPTRKLEHHGEGWTGEHSDVAETGAWAMFDQHAL